MNPRNRAPIAAPARVPEPPNVLTPPTTTAATMASVTPVAAVPLIVPNCITHITPARPAIRPHSEKATNTTSRDGMPMMAAASGLLPTAYTWRPKRVERRNRDPTITTPIAISTNTGIPKMSALLRSVNPSGSPASGTWSGPAMTYRIPRKMLSVPRVATIAGTLSTATMKPLIMPSPRPMARPIASAPTGSTRWSSRLRAML